MEVSGLVDRDSSRGIASTGRFASRIGRRPEVRECAPMMQSRGGKRYRICGRLAYVRSNAVTVRKDAELRSVGQTKRC